MSENKEVKNDAVEQQNSENTDVNNNGQANPYVAPAGQTAPTNQANPYVAPVGQTTPAGQANPYVAPVGQTTPAGQANPYVAPVGQTAPAGQANPYAAPVGQAPYGAPNGQAAPYGAPNGQAPYGAPNGQAPYGAPNGQAPYGMPNGQQFNAQPKQPNPNVEKAKGEAKNLFGHVKNIVMKPAEGVVKYAESGEFMGAIALLVINAIMYGIYMLALVKGIINLFVGVLSEALGGMASYIGIDSSMSMSEMGISGGKMFFLGFFLSLLSSASYILFHYVAAKSVYKCETDVKKVICAVSVSSIAMIPTLILTSVLTMLKPQAGLGLLGLGTILSTIYLYEAIKTFFKGKENTYIYEFAVVYLLQLAVVGIIGGLFL